MEQQCLNNQHEKTEEAEAIKSNLLDFCSFSLKEEEWKLQ